MAGFCSLCEWIGSNIALFEYQTPSRTPEEYFAWAERHVVRENALERFGRIADRTVSPQPSEGRCLAFLLTANPIKNIKHQQLTQKPGKLRGTCRVPLIREEEQRNRLARKPEDSAEIESILIVPHPPIFFRRGNRAGKLATVTFEGVLRVQDPRTLVKRLENGTGPAKAFGCGLLLVRRVKSV